MKRRLAILLTALPAFAVVNSTLGQVSISGGVQLNVPTPSVQVSTPGFGLQINAVGDFYQPLTPYGTWMNYQNYGQCWHPTQVAADWQPYTDGSWQYSDAGWYFNSEEPWGWATCHYGSWANDPSIGWIWIPGTQWAPAWVTWRTSDDYIGWAPCGPSMSVLAPSLFVFVGVHNFGGTFTPGANVFIRNNRTIINNTRVINGFNRRTVNFDGHQKTIFANTGPDVTHIQRATGRQFTARPVTDVVRQSKSRAPENLRNNENRTPEQQRYNNQQRPNENRQATPPPTGREQQRNYNNEQQNRLNQEQQQNNLENQNRLNQQQRQEQQRNNTENQNRLNQQREQQHPQAMPPTGREQQRNYNNEEQNRLNQQQQQQQQRNLENQNRLNQQQQREHSTVQPTPSTPSEKNLPATGREATPPSQRQQEVRPSQAPREVPTPSERATPPERNMAPTGRENAPSSQRQQEVRPSQAPEQHPPAQTPPGRDKKDNNQ